MEYISLCNHLDYIHSRTGKQAFSGSLGLWHSWMSQTKFQIPQVLYCRMKRQKSNTAQDTDWDVEWKSNQKRLCFKKAVVAVSKADQADFKITISPWKKVFHIGISSPKFIEVPNIFENIKFFMH